MVVAFERTLHYNASLGYSLEALVARERMARTFATRYRSARAIALAQGIEIVPLDRSADHGDSTGSSAWRGAQLVYRGHPLLPPPLASVLEELSRLGTVAYVEAEFSSEGPQAAVVWEHEVIVLGPIIDRDDDTLRRSGNARSTGRCARSAWKWMRPRSMSSTRLASARASQRGLAETRPELIVEPMTTQADWAGVNTAGQRTADRTDGGHEVAGLSSTAAQLTHRRLTEYPEWLDQARPGHAGTRLTSRAATTKPSAAHPNRLSQSPLLPE